MMWDRRSNPSRRQHFEKLRLDLLTRLRNVCGTMTPTELNELVRRMIWVRLKYEHTTSLPNPLER